jgi:hypothetical protein
VVTFQHVSTSHFRCAKIIVRSILKRSLQKLTSKERVCVCVCVGGGGTVYASPRISSPKTAQWSPIKFGIGNHEKWRGCPETQ